MPPAQDGQADQAAQKKKGLIGKITGIFKDSKQSNSVPKPPDATGTSH
jgi:hypothetical protein